MAVDHDVDHRADTSQHHHAGPAIGTPEASARCRAATDWLRRHGDSEQQARERGGDDARNELSHAEDCTDAVTGFDRGPLFAVGEPHIDVPSETGVDSLASARRRLFPVSDAHVRRVPHDSDSHRTYRGRRVRNRCVCERPA